MNLKGGPRSNDKADQVQHNSEQIWKIYSKLEAKKAVIIVMSCKAVLHPSYPVHAVTERLIEY